MRFGIGVGVLAVAVAGAAAAQTAPQLAPPTAAQTAPSPVTSGPPPGDRSARTVVELQVDNDTFASGRGKERWYTSGVFLRALHEADPQGIHARAARAWCAALSACAGDTARWRVFELGQALFTPSSVQTSAPQPDDRPYAGWLYFGTAVVVAGGDVRQTLGLRIGTTGPAALGEPSQDAVHRLLDQALAQGWRWQIRPRLGLQATWSGLRRLDLGSRDIDAVGRLGVALGNLQTEAAVGAVLRWGRLSASPTFPGEPGVPTPGDRVAGRWHVFAGGEARLVGRNRLVDGPVFGYQSRVDARDTVGDLFAGVSMTVARHWGIDLSVVRRTPEFDSPTLALRPQRFGSVLLRWMP